MIGKRLNIAEWNTYVASYDFGPIKPTRLVLHHTYIPNEQQWRGIASMRGMQSYYRNLGWSAAPHIYVAPDGIWLFTPMKDVGIHAGTGNSGWTNGVWWYSIGLEMVGYFDYKRPAGAVWNYATTVMSTFSQRVGIPPRQLISFHRDYTNEKSCPGWAVTKAWVFAEVEAALNNSPAPSEPPGEIGDPPPDEELLREQLLNESYRQRATGYHPTWAFHQYAVEQKLGAPIGNGGRITIGGKEYNYQPFAGDTLYNVVPNWGNVERLSALLGGSIPPSGLGRQLLDATYRAGGATFHAGWAFHQYAVSAGMGAPVGESGRVTVDGKNYSYQAFTRDTLYNLIPNWGDVKQLSRLANTRNPALQRLREALLAETYRRAGTRYHPEWAFHQLARTWYIGAPLSNSYQVSIGGVRYAIQVYAFDTLYNVVPRWSEVQRLSTLQQGGQALRRSLSLASASLFSSSSVNWQPPDLEEFPILQYTPTARTFEERDGADIRLVVLHGDPGPASATLDEMTTFGTPYSAHYYITADGTIYQLLDDQYAAIHSSVGIYAGRLRNINAISIAVVLERPETPLGFTQPQKQPDTVSRVAIRISRFLLRGSEALFRPFNNRDDEAPNGEDAGRYEHQLAPLHALLHTLLERHNLSSEAVIRASNLQLPFRSPPGFSRERLDDLPLHEVLP
jgi:hypothetical protein